MYYTRLSPGTRLIVQAEKNDELVALTMIFPAGIDTEHRQEGIGNMVGTMLLKGTTSLSSEQLAFEIERYGLSIDWQRGADYLFVSMVVHRHYLEKGLAIFFDFLFHPAFPDKELSTTQEEFYNAQQARYDKIFNVAYDLFLRSHYGPTHPYAWSMIGTKDSISALTRKDLSDYHAYALAPHDAVLTVIGNVDEQEMRQTFEEIMYHYASVPIKKKAYPIPLIQRHDPSIIHEKKTFTQSYVISGITAPGVHDAYYLETKMLNNYLGGGMSSVLFEQVREKQGLVYEISSVCPAKRYESFWAVCMGLDKTHVRIALDTVNRVLDSLVSTGLSHEKLTQLKHKMISEYALSHQTKQERALALGVCEITGKGFEYDAKIPALLEAITDEQIAGAIEQVFSRRVPVTVVVENE